MKRSNYIIHSETDNQILITDIGPWDVYLTVTNNAENVVNDLTDIQKQKQVFYNDSEGTISQLMIEDGKFIGYK